MIENPCNSTLIEECHRHCYMKKHRETEMFRANTELGCRSMTWLQCSLKEASYSEQVLTGITQFMRYVVPHTAAYRRLTYRLSEWEDRAAQDP